ncbi:hypothetical protein CL622_02895 [archaeon]|nr:hypothetical protein [archaeon]|tara:strand:- start:553 stop:1323 length:771 start_codon:yes stop_codon:yes gene_type:complete
MSYNTLKRSLTSNENSIPDLSDTLERTEDERDRLIELKMGITNTIFLPAIDVMSGYIIARQNYLNATDVGYTPAYSTTQDTMYKWRSPVTHTHNSTLCASQYYADYDTAGGSVSAWSIEKWTKYVDDNSVGASPGSLVPGTRYTNIKESYSDISHTKLAEVTGAPYSLDAGKHSLANLAHAASAFERSMVWIWATTNSGDPGSDSYGYTPSSDNPHHGIYNSWGINQQLDDTIVAIAALQASIDFHISLKVINSQY